MTGLRFELDTRATPEEAGTAAGEFLTESAAIVADLMPAAATYLGAVVGGTQPEPGVVAVELSTAARPGHGARGSRGGLTEPRLARARELLGAGAVESAEISVVHGDGPMSRRMLALMQVDYCGTWLAADMAHQLGLYLDLPLLVDLGRADDVASRLAALAVRLAEPLDAVGGFLTPTDRQGSVTPDEVAVSYGEDAGLRYVDRQVRGACWGTLVPAGLVATLGGPDSVAATAPVASVTRLGTGATWLRLTERFGDATEEQFAALRAYLEPLLPRPLRPRAVPGPGV